MIKLNNKMRWTISAIFAILILFGTYHNIFSIIAFLGICLLLFFCERETILLQLLFIMPMANIFKMSPSSQSFFTIILLLYVVMYFVLPRKATLLIVLFAVYIILGQLVSGSFMLFRTIKLICNVLFLSSVLNSEVEFDHKKIFLSYIVGNVVASFIGMLDSSFFKIKSYVGEIEVGGIEFIDLTRFTGLYTDPNYYTVGLIICLCLIVILYHREEISTLYSIFISATIIYFLIMTYSKSAIIMIVLPFGCLIYSLFKKRKNSSLIIILFSAIFIVMLALVGRINALNVVLTRFEASETMEGTDINSLTTGRFEHWMMYIKYLPNSLHTMIFGESISADPINGRAAHNTYLDMWYFLGIVGSVLLVLLLMSILSQNRHQIINKRNPLNYSVLIGILILYFFLSELFYFDLPFHIFLAFITLNLHCSTEYFRKKSYKH